MDYYRNADKWNTCTAGVSFNQVIDVDNNGTVGAELFTATQFKDEFAKIDTDDEGGLISALITSARRMCEQWVGMNFIARTVTATINNSNGGSYLPYGPVSGAPTATDADGAAITDLVLTGSAFKQVRTPVTDFVQVTYTGGYATGQCPAELITAVKMQALYMYENRGDVTGGLSTQAQQTLLPLKRI